MVSDVAEQWVILELGPKADGEDPDIVRASIRHTIRDADVFIPASTTKIGGDKVVQYLMEGYAFVRRTHPDASYYRLENTKYVQGVLRQPIHINGGRPQRRIATISSTEIDKFRKQIRVEVDQGIGVGDLVLITTGAYRQITARVESEILEQDSVQVFIRLRSKETIVTLPRGGLRLIQKAHRPPFIERTAALRDWLEGAQFILGWSKDHLSRVLLPYEAFLRLNHWVMEGRARVSFLKAFEIPFNAALLQAKYFEIQRLNRWVDRGKVLHRLLRSSPIVLDFETLRGSATKHLQLSSLVTRGKQLQTVLKPLLAPLEKPPLEAKYFELLWLQDVLSRLKTLASDVETLERGDTEEPVMFENVIVDGTQLAIRCREAPGLGTLCDSQGRPTGAIIGFLRSLGSFRKRFPGANVYVTWDGSNQRRRKLFAGYKASRMARVPLTFEGEFLKDILPLIGIHQAWNPEEEADDVIATLVQGSLKGQRNVFISTDRDLVQLVTETDHQFVPAVGPGKEKLLTPDSVQQEYGVSPKEILCVRALSGDPSDEIPGASGFGLKTAAKLVRLYGSLERLFTSNFAGLSKSQYASLRASEGQVRLNRTLMALQPDLPLTLLGSNPDQNAAASRLREVDIQPDPILAAFLPAYAPE